MFPVGQREYLLKVYICKAFDMFDQVFGGHFIEFAPLKWVQDC